MPSAPGFFTVSSVTTSADWWARRALVYCAALSVVVEASMKSDGRGTAKTFAASMRWAMSSTAAGGMAVMYLTCSAGWAGRGSVFQVVFSVAGPLPSSYVRVTV